MKLSNPKKIINDQDVVYPSVLFADARAVPDECETPFFQRDFWKHISTRVSKETSLSTQSSSRALPLSNKVS